MSITIQSANLMIEGLIFGAVLFMAFAAISLACLSSELIYLRQVEVWCDEREKLLLPIMQQAFAVRSVPVHKGFTEAPGGNVAYRGTMLNFDTLKEMTFLMVNMEQERQVASNQLGRSLDVLVKWEHDNPPPTRHLFLGGLKWIRKSNTKSTISEPKSETRRSGDDANANVFGLGRGDTPTNTWGIR